MKKEALIFNIGVGHIIGYADRYYDNSITSMTVKIVIDTRIDCS